MIGFFHTWMSQIVMMRCKLTNPPKWTISLRIFLSVNIQKSGNLVYMDLLLTWAQVYMLVTMFVILRKTASGSTLMM